MIWRGRDKTLERRRTVRSDDYQMWEGRGRWIKRSGGVARQGRRDMLDVQENRGKRQRGEGRSRWGTAMVEERGMGGARRRQQRAATGSARGSGSRGGAWEGRSAWERGNGSMRRHARYEGAAAREESGKGGAHGRRQRAAAGSARGSGCGRASRTLQGEADLSSNLLNDMLPDLAALLNLDIIDTKNIWI